MIRMLKMKYVPQVRKLNGFLFIEYAIGEMHVLLTYNDPRAAYQSLWGS